MAARSACSSTSCPSSLRARARRQPQGFL
jgi:hypothetical protein